MTSLNLRLPEELHKAIRELAQKDKRSINSEILFILEEYVKQQQEAKKQSQ